MEKYILEQMISSDSLLFEVVMAFLQLIVQMKSSGGMFYISIASAMIISVVVVWLFGVIVRNVNKAYEIGFGFTLGSLFSFCTTFIFVIFMFSLQFTEPVVKVVVKNWEMALSANKAWSDSTFREAYESVAALKTSNGRSLENFDNFPHPDMGGSLIPGKSDQAKVAVIDTYLNSAVGNFENTMPLLSWILSAKSGTAKTDIYQDMVSYFEKSSTYDMSGAVNIAGEKISDELIKQSGRIITLATLILLVSWLCFQIVIVGSVSWAALRNIREDF
ncbi:hypothetical protein [Vibrio sp. WXL103]|uniref:hypothetical protein n=1 Tax=Vibrio sp. WXL103 TaxID=3450710 RepID=UPI003EC76CD9